MPHRSTHCGIDRLHKTNVATVKAGRGCNFGLKQDVDVIPTAIPIGLMSPNPTPPTATTSDFQLIYKSHILSILQPPS
jgi:hypothetical protein